MINNRMVKNLTNFNYNGKLLLDEPQIYALQNDLFHKTYDNNQ